MTKEDGMFGLSIEAANSAANWTYLFAGGAAVFFTALTVAASFVMWTTSAQIDAEKDRQLKTFQTESGERVALLQKETKDAQLKLEEERTNRLKLQSALSSRHLSPEQSAALSGAVRAMAGSVTLTYTSDAETLAFAQDIGSAIENGGIEVIPNGAGIIVPKPYGVIVTVNQDPHPLLTALRTAGVAFTVQFSAAPGASILIGEKPPPF